ncbi:unnamed protein product [marine sediment metagenome]|uniref:C2H2-type domain-containing protein n=3 Tax=marine sediment metagenome TaxID=412755 RepID=X1GFZ3_9ZZZZ
MASKKPLTCPVCKKRFSYSAKTNPFARQSKHMWSKHRAYMLKKQKSGKRKAKSRASQLDKELQWTDDMIINSLQKAGIPLQMPMQNQAPYLNPYAPTQHQSITGVIISAFKAGQMAYGAYKAVKGVSSAVKKAKKK